MRPLGMDLNRLFGRTARRRLFTYYLLFSLFWVAALFGFGAGYWQETAEIGGQIAISRYINFAVLVIGPLLAIWGPFLVGSEAIPRSRSRTGGLKEREGAYRAEFDKLQNELASIRASLAMIKAGQSDPNAQNVGIGSSDDAGHRRKAHMRPADGADMSDFASPALPIDNGRNSNPTPSLSDFAMVLHFSDRRRQGEWANALNLVRQHGVFMDLMRMGEAVIEVFEQEGIFVENIDFNPPPQIAWRALALGEKSDPIIGELAGVHDQSLLAMVRLRLRNDPEFYELSLRFVKRVVELAARFVDYADEEEFYALGDSRAGRAFSVIGHLTGAFHQQGAS